MSDRFSRAFALVLGHEGGWVDNPADRGGETYKGIARTFWPQWEGWALVDMIKAGIGPVPRYGTSDYWAYVKRLNPRLAANPGLQSLVEMFYRKNFWLPAYEALASEPLAVWLFDKAVNLGLVAGKCRAHRWLQQALDLPDDGIIGPQTLKAANGYPDQTALLEAAREKARAFYRDKARKDPSQAQFLNGWLARV